MRRHSPRRQKRPGCLRDRRRRIRGTNMANLKFDKEITALRVIDPYSDFISEGSKVWDRLKTVAEANGCVPHMLQVLNAARKARFLCAASSISPWRLRDLEIHCACPEGGLVKMENS